MDVALLGSGEEHGPLCPLNILHRSQQPDSNPTVTIKALWRRQAEKGFFDRMIWCSTC